MGPSLSSSKSTSSSRVPRSGAVSYQLAGCCGHQFHHGRGAKKPETPLHMPHSAMLPSHQPRMGCGRSGGSGSSGTARLTRSQNSRSRCARSGAGLPAISAALMAPIEMPATQCSSGARAASASKAPAW